LGSAFNQLVNWAENVLPDLIMDPIRQLVNILIDVLDLIPVFGPVAGNVLEYFANIFGLLADKSQEAQDTADHAKEAAEEAQSAANSSAEDAAVTAATTDSTGALIIDRFTGAEDNHTDGLGTDWVETYDSGSGTLGLDGEGNARWFQAGNGSRYCRARYVTTSLTTDVQKASIVVNSKMPGYFVNPEIWICLRMDSTGSQNYVSARLYDGGCEIGYTTSNTYHRIGSAVSVSHSAGDTWTFCAGTASDDYAFELYQNGNLRVSVTDSTASSLKGSGYRQSGLRVRAGAQSFTWYTEQRAHPRIQVFTAIDYTP